MSLAGHDSKGGRHLRRKSRLRIDIDDANLVPESLKSSHSARVEDAAGTTAHTDFILTGVERRFDDPNLHLKKSARGPHARSIMAGAARLWTINALRPYRERKFIGQWLTW